MKYTKSFLVFLFVSVTIATFFVAVFYTDTVKAALWSVNNSDSLTLSPSTNSISLSWSLSQINGGTQTIYRNGSVIASVGVGTSSYTSSGLATCTSYSYSVCSAYGCASASASTTGCDPCAGVTCNAYCSGSTAYYSGYCSGGACYYSTDNCAVGFCSGMTPYPGATCSAGSCTRVAGSTCLSSTCGGSYGTTYYYSGYCSAGVCGYGASSITAGTCGAVCTPGTTRTRYNSSSVACGTACASETQTCNAYGTGWSGSYTGTSCTASTRTAYQALTSACGTYSYNSESQTCQTNGVWTGSYTLTSPPSTTSRTRYAALTSACGTYGSTSETQYCQSNGVFDGTYTLTSPASATTRTRYQASSVVCGSSCVSETQTCQSNGTWTGTYAYSSCSVMTCPPAAPSSLSPVSISTSQIYLSWNSSSGATSYTLKRGAATIYSGSGTTYTDSGLSANTQYSYSVYASNSGGDSGTTNASTYTRPNAPSLSGSANSQTSILLSYSYDSGTTYSLYKGETLLAQGSSATGYLDQGLSCGTSYTYQIYTTNSGGTSASTFGTYSTTVCAPSTPTGFTATAASGTQINLSWNAVSGATSYTLAHPGGPTIYSGASTSFSETGLNCNTSYSYTVSACNAGGCSANASANATTVICSPSFSNVCLNGVTQPFAIWNTSSGATGYKLYRAPAGGPQTLVYNGTSTGFVDSSLNSTTVYTYYVSAYNGSGESSQTSQSIETGNGTFTSLSGEWGGSTDVDLSWTNPNPSWSVANLIIYRNGVQIYNAGGPTSITTYTDAGLSWNTTYSYYVFYGYSPPCGLAVNQTSNTVNVTVPVAPPTAPSNLSADAVSGTQVNLSWTGSTGGVGDIGYNVYRCSGSGCTNDSYIGWSAHPTTSYSDTGLTCGTTYGYRVSSYDSRPLSGGSTSRVYVTPPCDSTPPTFSISGSGANWMTLASTTATASDASGISYVRHCWVDTQGVPPCDPGTTSASTFTNGATLTQTTSGSSWYACFRARDAVGNWTPALTLGNYATYCWGPVRVDVTAPTPTPTPSQTSADSTSVTVSAGVTGSDAHSGLDANAYGFSTNGTNYTWTSSNSYTFTNLTCGTNYTAYVKIRDAVGNMTNAGTASINTSSCVVPPSAVSGLSVTEQSGGSGLNASWNSVSADGYRVYMKGGRSSPNTVGLIQNSSGTSVPQTGLQCPSSYTVYVVAYNSDASIGGVDSSCSTTFSSGDLSTVGTVPSNVKCSAVQTATVEIRSCTRGFLLE